MSLRTPDVELRVPADAAFANILRTAAAGLAARVEFSIDDVEDLRAAVDEACALLLPVAQDGSALDCSFWLEPDGISFAVTGIPRQPAEGLRPVLQGAGFGWQVLEALTDEATYDQAEGTVTIALIRRRRAPAAMPGGTPQPA